jgi:hypothetical protein
MRDDGGRRPYRRRAGLSPWLRSRSKHVGLDLLVAVPLVRDFAFG